ncbi:MAG: hypothetical protein ACLUEQ_01910 [Cloacibacillus evryensis]
MRERMRCGTTRPTKPMIPKKLTAAAVAGDETATAARAAFLVDADGPVPRRADGVGGARK